MNDKLTASLEDYLEIIFNAEKDGLQIHAADISKAFGISRASVSEAMQKLNARGLIVYNKTITLTEEGRLKAQDVVSKHKIIQQFFEDILGLDTQDASDNACKIEHVISESAFKKISDFLKNR